MEEKKTVQYKRTMRGTMGAGASALFNGSGRRFYILEHRDASKYHKAGESQKIIVDQVELGRLPDCQVRFDDETWDIVSRRHAAIVRENDRWKLVQLSQTNSTFLNGQKIDTEWYLANGDEIQLAVNGPRLGFIVPEGKQGLVSSIKLTERLKLFQKQALAPYKRAIAALVAVLVILSGLGAYALHNQSEQIDTLFAYNEKNDTIIARIQINADSANKQREQYQKEVEVKYVTIYNQGKAIEKEMKNIKGVAGFVDKAKPSVYAVITTTTVTFPNGKSAKMQSQGTGFLLDDGRFVTARHCVQPWMFDTGTLFEAHALSEKYEDVKMTTTIHGYSMNDEITLSSSQFTVDSSQDISFPYSIDIGDGESVSITGKLAFPIKFKDGTALGNVSMMGSDWAYARVNKKGAIKAAPSLSSSLKAGTEVHVLGFPAGLGIKDGKHTVEPIYNKMTISREGLNEARCIMVSEGVAHGNSGGPVFTVHNGELVVIGIVSRKESATQQQGMFGITQQQQQYDQLVPISNLR